MSPPTRVLTGDQHAQDDLGSEVARWTNLTEIAEQ
jgi:hypothetical protein